MVGGEHQPWNGTPYQNRNELQTNHGSKNVAML